MSEAIAKNYFTDLFAVNVSDKIEKKNGLSYVSWSYAWAEVKKRYPDANYTIYENKDGWFYHTDGKTCWVKTGLTVNGIEHIEMLPVMDFKNRSIPVDHVTSMDVNKAIQRSLTKAAARHGLGLYVYAGEDLPEEEQAKKEEKQPDKQPEPKEPRRDAPASVSTGSKVPAKASPVKAYVDKQLTLMKELYGIADTNEVIAKFKEMRQALIDGGVIPDIKGEDQTIEDAMQMFEAIYANFKPSGDAA